MLGLEEKLMSQQSLQEKWDPPAWKGNADFKLSTNLLKSFVLYIKYALALGLGHALVLPGRQPNSVGALGKGQELCSSRMGPGGQPHTLPCAQPFLHRGSISQNDATGWEGN